MGNGAESPDIVVEAARPSDISDMIMLGERWSWRNLPPGAVSSTGALYNPLDADGLARIIADKNSCVLAARDQNELVGMLVGVEKALALEMYPNLSTRYAPSNSVWQESFIYLKAIATRPDLLGQRVGSRVLSTFCEIARQRKYGSALAVIAVDPPNTRSLALFQKVLGGQEIGRHPDLERVIVWGLYKSDPLVSISFV